MASGAKVGLRHKRRSQGQKMTSGTKVGLRDILVRHVSLYFIEYLILADAYYINRLKSFSI
jgi:hypothetical protein